MTKHPTCIKLGCQIPSVCPIGTCALADAVAEAEQSANIIIAELYREIADLRHDIARAVARNAELETKLAIAMLTDYDEPSAGESEGTQEQVGKRSTAPSNDVQSSSQPAPRTAGLNALMDEVTQAEINDLEYDSCRADAQPIKIPGIKDPKGDTVTHSRDDPYDGQPTSWDNLLLENEIAHHDTSGRK